MENEEMVEATVQEIAPELKTQIEKKVADLKQKNPAVKVIFPIVVFGEDYDEKEIYVAYFRQPSFAAFSKYLAAAQRGNQAVAMKTLANDCFLDGDRELVDDESLFLFGLMGQFSQIIEMRNGRLANFTKPRK